MPPKKAPAAKAKAVKRNVEKEEAVPEKKSKLTTKIDGPSTTKEKTETKKPKELDSENSKPRNKTSKSKKENVEELQEPDTTAGRKVSTRAKKIQETGNSVPEKKKLTSKKENVKETEESVQSSKNTAKPKVKRAKKVEEDSPDSDVEEEPPAKKAPKRKATKTSEKEVQKAAPKNSTNTNWESVDFKCTTKTTDGKEPNFHITCWNVGGVRAWLKKGGLNILNYDKPDILCLQEIKCSEEKLPEEITKVEGYEAFWCSSEKDGYAGVAVLSKTTPLNVTYGIESEDHDDEGRCITAEFDSFYLVNVYVPNSGRKLVTLPKRLEWNKVFQEYIKNLDTKKPVILCGDMNVAHSEIDLANPKSNTKNAGFTPEEREGMTDFLESGYVDTFRKLYPEKEKAYTFWSFMSNARAKNVGWRLDYFLVSEKLTDNVCDNIIFSEVFGSDHCPLALYLNL